MQALELAIVLPILLLLFSSGVELGRLFSTYSSLQKATYASARYFTITKDAQGAIKLVQDERSDASVQIIQSENYVTIQANYQIKGVVLPFSYTLTPQTTARMP